VVALAACQGTPTPREVATPAPTAVLERAECREAVSVSEVPADVADRPNPVPPTASNLAVGQRLYHQDAEPVACVQCHGERGDGDGPVGRYLDPPPADFTCLAGLPEVSDGQLYWVIAHGADFMGHVTHPADNVRRPGRRGSRSAMQLHRFNLDDTEIWQLVLYLRTFGE